MIEKEDRIALEKVSGMPEIERPVDNDQRPKKSDNGGAAWMFNHGFRRRFAGIIF